MNRIRVRQKHNWFSRLFIVALLVGLWRVFDRRSRERIPSQEGIEDPEVAVAFEWVTRMPQMRWIRHFVSSQATVLKDHGEAIDLGCGAGQLVVEIAQKAPGLHVTGIDLSEELLADARESAQRAGLEDQVDFRLGNVEEIPFPDRSLDLVISTASLHHWSEPVKVLNEIDRVLKPGGAYYIFDLRRDMALHFYLLIWFATQFIVPAALHRVNEPMGSRNASYTVQELADLVQQSGLHGGLVTTGPIWIVLAGKKSVALIK
jgi:ubiquinone/menaquinone biosynthesis C-methylase UbiE